MNPPQQNILSAFYKKRDPAAYQQALAHLIEETKKGRMFGEWNVFDKPRGEGKSYGVCTIPRRENEG